jgi:hypothetical protein
MNADDAHLATDPYRSTAVYQSTAVLPASRSHSPYSWPQLNGNAATDERSRPRQDGRHTVVARGITGDFTPEHAAAGTACGDGVFNGANSPCRCHRIHARRSGRRIDHRQAVPVGMLAR